MKSNSLNILVPTDFSNNAWSATVYALSLYAEHKCTFYFLNSLALSHADSRAYMTTRYVDTLTETSKRELNEWKARAMKLDNTNHNFEMIYTSEDIIPAINRAVKQHQIDLVVAGTKGASGVTKYFLGSNAVKMIQNLEVSPMLAVPDNHEFKAPKHIAFPTDFNRVFNAKELKVLTDFADLFKSHIYILHINLKEELSDVQQNNRRALQAHMENSEHTFHWMDKSGTKSDEINEFIEDFKIDLLAMFNYKHSFVENIMKEPVIKKIGFQLTVPFLVIPE
ncbi:MAG: universal stress protein [Gelidibacter sp.]